MRKTVIPLPAEVDRHIRAKSKHGAVHHHQKAGSKLVRAFYRAKHGSRDERAKEAKWWAQYRAEGATA